MKPALCWQPAASSKCLSSSRPQKVRYLGAALAPLKFTLGWLTKGLLFLTGAFLFSMGPASSQILLQLAHKRSESSNLTPGGLQKGLLRWHLLTFLL